MRHAYGSIDWSAWARPVVFSWTLLALATDLKGVIPYIHWVATAVALFLITPYMLTRPIQKTSPARFGALLLLGSVCVPAFYGAPPLHSFGEAAKLAIILLGALSILVSNSSLARAGFKAFVASIWLETALMIGGVAGIGTARLMSPSRWGTLASFPGSLWRVAMTVWVFAAYVAIKKKSALYLVLLLASTFLVYMDGARTAVLVLAGAFLFLGFVLLAEAGRVKFALTVCCLSCVSVMGLIFYSGLFTGLEGTVTQGGLVRIAKFFDSLQESGFEGLETADAARFEMIVHATDEIRLHPLLGTGIGTTTIETADGPMVVHMTYMQVWADMGLLGLVSYVLLTWGWLLWLSPALANIALMSDSKERAIYYNAVFVLLLYGVTSCFHPLSTELSEWIVFLIPYALLWQASRRRTVGTGTLRMAEAYA